MTSSDIWTADRMRNSYSIYTTESSDDRRQMEKLIKEVKTLDFLIPELKNFHEDQYNSKTEIDFLKINTVEMAGRLMMGITVMDGKIERAYLCIITESSPDYESSWGLQTLYGCMEDFYKAIDLVRKEWKNQSLYKPKTIVF